MNTLLYFTNKSRVFDFKSTSTIIRVRTNIQYGQQGNSSNFIDSQILKKHSMPNISNSNMIMSQLFISN